MITADDVAALVVLADREAPFQHHLKSDFINLRWVLDVDSDGTERPGLTERVAGSPSVARKRKEVTMRSGASTPGPRSGAPSNAASPSHGGSRASAATPENTTTPRADDAGGDHMPDDKAATPTRSGSPAPHHHKPPPMLNLDALDTAVSAEDLSTKNGGRSLITTPRSALILLRNGFGVADILGVPKKGIRNRALLDGAGKDAVAMRLAADGNRRKMRREMVDQQYRELCGVAARDDVVEAMRSQFFAIDRESRHNATATSASLEPVVPVAGSTKALLDEDCVEALSKARDRAAAEMSRVVDQTERQRRRTLQKEEALFRQQAALAGEAKQSNVHRDRLLAARRAAAQQKIEEARERSRRLQDAEKAKIEQRRAELLNQRDVTEDRAQAKRGLSRKATKALVKVVEERREVVRRNERELIESRRSELEAKSQFKQLLHDRAIASRDKELADRRAESELREKERKEHLREVAQREATRKEQEHQALLDAAARRAEEIQQARQVRRAAKRERAAARHERLAETQAARDEQEQLRLMEQDALYEDKQVTIAKAEAERKRAIVEANERKALARLEREDEQRRARAVAEYKYVGYVSGTHHKGGWMEREAGKRRVLGLQLRQEREAIRRSRDEMLKEIETRDQNERRRIELQFR